MAAVAKARLPWVLLTVSLALNLFFAGGAIYTKLTAEQWASESEQRLEVVVERLELSADRRAGLEALRERVQMRMASLRGGWRESRKEMLAELARPELDRARVKELMQRGMTARAALFEELLVDLHAYLGTLSDAQRRSFLEMAEERGFMRDLFGPGRRRR